MVSDIDNLTDLGKGLMDSLLDPLIQRHTDHTTALTAASKPDIDDVVVHIHEFNVAAVAGDGGIDLGIEQLLNGHGLGIGPERVGVTNPKPTLLQLFHIVDDDVSHVWSTLSVDDHGESTHIHDDIVSLCIPLFDELHIISKACRTAPNDGDAQAITWLPLRLDDRQNLALRRFSNCQHAYLISLKKSTQPGSAIVPARIWRALAPRLIVALDGGKSNRSRAEA